MTALRAWAMLDALVGGITGHGTTLKPISFNQVLPIPIHLVHQQRQVHASTVKARALLKLLDTPKLHQILLACKLE